MSIKIVGEIEEKKISDLIIKEITLDKDGNPEKTKDDSSKETLDVSAKDYKLTSQIGNTLVLISRVDNKSLRQIKEEKSLNLKVKLK